MSIVLGSRSTAPARNGSVLAVLTVALLLALAQVAVIDRVWQDCMVGAQVHLARGQLIAICLPALLFANALLVALPAAVYGPKNGSTGGRATVTALAILVLLFAETLMLARYVATPSPQTASVCVENTPQWWPTWLPS
jgi:hypothetical protein